MGLFTVTPDEIKKAKETGFYQLVDGTVYQFSIVGLDEKEDDAMLLKCIILSQEGNGKNYNLFFGNNEQGRSEFIRLAMLFFTQEEMFAGFQPANLIGKTFEADAVASTSKKTKKTYVNLRKYRLVDNTPQLPSDEPTAEQAAEKVGMSIEDAVETAKGLF